MGEPLFPTEALLWVARCILLISAVLHIIAAVELTLMNRSARPLGYETKKSHAATFAALTMRCSGVLLALFIVYHLLHLTARGGRFQARRVSAPRGLQQRRGRRFPSGMSRCSTSCRWPRFACIWITESGACFRRSGLNNARISPGLRMMSRG